MNKTYKFGKYNFRAYCKPVGQGWEVGCNFHGKSIFLGNFIHKIEATRWWNLLNREVRTFTRKYWVTQDASLVWYSRFFSSHLYNCYYGFLDKVFAQRNRVNAREFSRNARKYKSVRRNLDAREKFVIRAA